MSPRTGRPKSDNPKDINVKVRFDKTEHEELLKYCEEHNITRTEAIRQGIRLLLEQKK
ncbi:MAG: CopG family transcriptional regulator [Oscillospiraceae bacterium]|nr:CopG family transcriptional regulator [Oscillospiraceae bacterium]